jgi:Uri superfamily endonuclease
VETEQARPGTYALVLLSRSNDLIRIGKLGMLHVQPGFYVYFGSALGPGGVRGRLAHHLQLSSRPHWHIDYLRAHTTIEEIWCCLGRRRREHMWAQKLGRLPDAEVPLAGFGATDCRCESHLYFFRKRPSARSIHKGIADL